MFPVVLGVPQETAAPVFLPISEGSVRALLARTENVPKAHDLTFIGEMYLYRARVIDDLVARGMTVTVNPHRSAGDARATYLDFAAMLAQSRLTINFSRCSSLPLNQLKSRMLEVGLAGSVAISDESDLSGTFLRPGQDFLVARTPATLVDVARFALDHEDERAEMERSARKASALLAPVSFWDVINADLLKGSQRGARPLLRSSLNCWRPGGAPPRGSR